MTGDVLILEVQAPGSVGDTAPVQMRGMTLLVRHELADAALNGDEVACAAIGSELAAVLRGGPPKRMATESDQVRARMGAR